MDIVVDRITSLMKEKGVKQAFVAEIIGSYATVVTDWKRGRSKPSQNDLEKLALFFDCSLDYISGRTDERKPIKKKPVLEISENGHKMLELFERLPKDKQDILIKLAQDMVSASENERDTGTSKSGGMVG